MFNTLIVCYLFLGGAGAGALTLLSVLELARASHRFGHMRPTAADQAMSKEFFARCWSICVVILIFGVLCLLVDLGHPERVLNLLISPTLTPITIGAYSLAGALVCSGVFAAVELLDSFHPAIWAIRVLALLGIALGLTASLYTGMLLQSMASVVFWNTPLLPALFLLSSLSTGIACLFLGTVFVEGRIAPFRPVVLLARIDVVLIVLEALCLVSLLVTSAANPDARAAFDALVSGEFRWAFWLG
ncbi:MAG: NrfD/PsrC family molybdoenzyme membrane anchor subunit, partial [Raoultibacter sp.]